MTKAPATCPQCGERNQWERIDADGQNFSLKKAAISKFLLGNLGILFYLLNKKKKLYHCYKCGFEKKY